MGTTNPDTPSNFVKTDFLDRREELSLQDIQFTMLDNPANTTEYIKQVDLEYTGVFHDRFIKGLWVLAEGLIHPRFEEAVVPTKERPYTEYQVAADYGIHNPTCFGLFGKCDGVWYLIKEFRHSGRETNSPKTDEEYYNGLVSFVGRVPVRRVIVDPSASSFITLIRRKGRFIVKEADNSVLDGIRNMATALANGKLRINDCCEHARAEAKAYAWDEKSPEDKPIKESDHFMDLIRYFAQTEMSKARAVGGRKPKGW